MCRTGTIEGGILLMSKVKKIGFNFFRPVTDNEDRGIQRIDLEPLFELLRTQYLRGRENTQNGEGEQYKRVYSYNFEPARLSDITIDEGTQYFHLTFERLNYALPNRTTLHGDSEMLDLEDDEYIGHESNVLYDSTHRILMIQRNRDSLGPTAIASFIEALLMEAEAATNFSIAMISDDTARRRAFNQSAYRKISTRVVGQKANDLLGRLTDQRPQGIESVEITFNSRGTKNGEIDNDFSSQFLEEYTDDPDVQMLRIRSREDEESPVEPIDLINHKLEAYAYFELQNDRQLNSLRVFDEMRNLFDVGDTRSNGGYRNKIMGMR